MSKKLIAGAGVVASLAVALAPLATFAAGTSRVDTLAPTIQASCTIVTPETGSANNLYNGDVTPGTDTQLTRVTSGTDGHENEQTITISCNNENGYKIMATGTNLVHHSDTTAVISPVDPTSTGASHYSINITPTTVSGGNLVAESAFAGSNYGHLTAAGTATKVASKVFDPTHLETVEESFTVNYKVYANTTQKSGAYEGTVTYTLATPAS